LSEQRSSDHGAVAQQGQGQHGFALLIVLWVLVLIAFLVAQITTSGRTELRIASNIYDNAAAEAAVEGAINEAVFHLSDPDPDRAWQADDGRRELVIGRSRVELRIDNEAARVNPNFASPELVQGLLLATGSSAENSQHLALAIANWVGVPVPGSTPAAAAAQYRAGGLDYAPPGQPMEALDELRRVIGMTPDIFAALRPHLTIYGPPVPDPQTPDPVVAAALAFVARQHGGSLAAAMIASRRGGLVTVRVTATAHGPNNAETARVAVVRLGASLPQRAVILAWGASLD